MCVHLWILFVHLYRICVHPYRLCVHPLHNVCTPVYMVCAPLQNMCTPVQIVCTPLQNVCAPLQNVCTPLHNVCTPVQNVYTFSTSLPISMNVTQTSITYQKSKFVMFGSRALQIRKLQLICPSRVSGNSQSGCWNTNRQLCNWHCCSVASQHSPPPAHSLLALRSMQTRTAHWAILYAN
jgi:hypothetical protein